MSFILDALKKSESDRQRKSSPDISDVPTAVSPSGNPRGLWLTIGALTITVLVLLIVMLRTGLVGVTASAPDESVALEMPAVVTIEESEPVRADAPPVRAERERRATDEFTVERSTEPETAVPKPVVAVSAPADTETFLTFNDLRATGSLGLPDLHIDLHVYSDNPTERFVFINMNQYRENATLSEGPRLRQITTEGVVLEYVGTTFLLPRE